MSKIKFNLTKIAAVVIVVCTLLTTMTVAFAAEKKYTIDLQSVPDQQFYDSRCVIRFELEGRDPVVVKGDDNLGYPVLMNVKNLGGVTLIPVRAICEALGLEVGWQNATAEEAAHALISTPNHGDVKLYSGATSITTDDGVTYQETTYTFPDGSPIPLVVFRNGRTYVPVRFITSFVVENSSFAWTTNSTLIIKGSMAEVAETEGAWNGVGVNHQLEWMDNESALETMKNTAAVIEELGLAYKAEGNALAVEHVAICNNIITDGLVLKGFSYSSVSRLNYAAAIAMLKDVLDAESATALINWIEELDRLHQVYYNAKVGSEEEAAAKTALYAHGNKLWEATSPVKFGNVLVSWYEDGNVIGFIISNA